MKNETFFQSIAEIAKTVPGTKVVVGGNAPVMVKCFQRLGLQVLLGAQMTDELRRKIGTDVEGFVIFANYSTVVLDLLSHYQTRC